MLLNEGKETWPSLDTSSDISGILADNFRNLNLQSPIKLIGDIYKSVEELNTK